MKSTRNLVSYMLMIQSKYQLLHKDYAGVHRMDYLTSGNNSIGGIFKV